MAVECPVSNPRDGLGPLGSSSISKASITALTLVKAMEAEEPADEHEDIYLVSCIYCLTLSLFMRISSPPSHGMGGFW